MFNRTYHPVYMGLVAGALLNVATPAYAVDGATAKAVAEGLAPPVYLVDSDGKPARSGSYNPKADPAVYDCVIGGHSRNAAENKKYTEYSEFTAEALEKFEAELALLKACGYSAPDSDKDGVGNYRDKCPDTAAGITVGEDGCSHDSDNDGVPDSSDKCPNNSAEEISAGVYKSGPMMGCPVDSDGDGVPDYRDKCPGTAPNTGVDSDGCPVTTVQIETELTEDHVRFDFDKAILKPAGKAVVDKMIKFLTGDLAHVKGVQLVGHTDSTGPADYNMGLSQRRAQSVVDYMTAGGVPTGKIVATGKGESSPVASNKTSAGRAANRRVEITVQMTNK